MHSLLKMASQKIYNVHDVSEKLSSEYLNANLMMLDSQIHFQREKELGATHQVIPL